jgi:putative transposase
MLRTHQIALDLTKTQEAYCHRAAGVARFTYNWALAEWKRRYAAGEKPTAAALKEQWNAIKHVQFPWVAEVHKDANQQPFTHLRTAFQQFFRHETRYPRFKKKGQHDSFYASNDKCALQGKRLRLPVLGWVRMREALRFPGKVMGVTVSRIAHRWYASVVVSLDATSTHCENQAVVGVDLGVRHLATLSTGEMVAGPKPLRKLAQAVQRCSQRLSRTVQGSTNRRKAHRLLARLHARIAFQRADTLHKLTTALVQWCGTVVIEDLHVKGMMRNHHLARALSDMGFGMFRRLLTYKAAMTGVTLVVVDRWFPSSKRCSQCGQLHETLTLQDWLFQCSACGFACDRDLNAAINLSKLPMAGGEVTPVERGALATRSLLS